MDLNLQHLHFKNSSQPSVGVVRFRETKLSSHFRSLQRNPGSVSLAVALWLYLAFCESLLS